MKKATRDIACLGQRTRELSCSHLAEPTTFCHFLRLPECILQFPFHLGLTIHPKLTLVVEQTLAERRVWKLLSEAGMKADYTEYVFMNIFIYKKGANFIDFKYTVLRASQYFFSTLFSPAPHSPPFPLLFF